MNDEVEEQGGTSFRDIFRIIGKRIWFVLVGAIVVTLAAVLIFMFAFNSSSKSMTFRIEYPMSSEGKYPDGFIFNYRDIVSEKVVKAVKDVSGYKDEFASLDVNKLVKDEAVKIKARQLSDDSEPRYEYTISIESSYLKGIKAEHFVDALTEAFITEIVAPKAALLDFKLDEMVFQKASYKDQLAFLTEQKAIIVNQYGNWIAEYEVGYQVLGKSLGTRHTEAKTVFAEKDRDSIEDDITMKGFEYFNGFVGKSDGDKIQEVKERLVQLQTELIFVQAILEDLGSYNTGVAGYSAESAYASENKAVRSFAAAYADDNTGTASNGGGSTTVVVGGNSEMLSYIKRSQTIQQQITYLTGQTSLKGVSPEKMNIAGVDATEFNSIVKEIEEFSAKLMTQFSAINESANTLTDVIHAIYLQDTLVNFTSDRATKESGTSPVIVGVVVFVVAFLVLAVIAYFIGKKGEKGKRGAPAAAKPAPNTAEVFEEEPHKGGGENNGKTE